MDTEIRKLGFGLMRLPQKDGHIDVETTAQMVDRFLAAGFTYFDTAYCYQDGESEAVAKQVLVDRYPRDSFQLATKLPAWAGAKTREEAEAMFDTSLERTGAGYFDYFLLHNLCTGLTEYFDKFDSWSYLRRRKEEGLIRKLGFSFHDKAEELDRLLTLHPDMDFVQLQINYADWENPVVQSRACYEVARKHGKEIIIMEPVKGGILAHPPAAVLERMRAADPDASPASWAIRFAASLEGVITVLSGMSTPEQMEDNLSFMADFRPLDEAERAVIADAQEILAGIHTVPCTGCQYCMAGCPKGIAIPGTFEAVNLLYLYGDRAAALHTYDWNTNGLKLTPADACIGCGKCQKVCPQHIPIVDELKKAVSLLKP